MPSDTEKRRIKDHRDDEKYWTDCLSKLSSTSKDNQKPRYEWVRKGWKHTVRRGIKSVGRSRPTETESGGLWGEGESDKGVNPWPKVRWPEEEDNQKTQDRAGEVSGWDNSDNWGPQAHKQEPANQENSGNFGNSKPQDNAREGVNEGKGDKNDNRGPQVHNQEPVNQEKSGSGDNLAPRGHRDTSRHRGTCKKSSRGDEGRTNDRDDSDNVIIVTEEPEPRWTSGHNRSSKDKVAVGPREHIRRNWRYSEIDAATDDHNARINSVRNRHRKQIAGRQDDLRPHYNPRSRMRNSYPPKYNFDIDPAAIALDTIVIGSFFSLRDFPMETRAEAITQLLLHQMLADDTVDFEQLCTRNADTYLDWFARDEGGSDTFWAFQRDREGWHNWHLVKDFEIRSGLQDVRDQLIKDRNTISDDIISNDTIPDDTTSDTISEDTRELGLRRKARGVTTPTPPAIPSSGIEQSTPPPIEPHRDAPLPSEPQEPHW
ncbi:hypothetical protein MMC07_007651 [Pseudocyphellaria aurata]|nr:hypothetical protein [Pseudocyphellaria aurata]